MITSQEKTEIKKYIIRQKNDLAENCLDQSAQEYFKADAENTLMEGIAKNYSYALIVDTIYNSYIMLLETYSE